MMTRRALLTLALLPSLGLIGIAGCGGGSGEPLTPSPSATPNVEPRFSTGKIVYLSEQPSGRTIVLARPDGTTRTIVRPDAPGALNSSPSLSPDGNRIAFVSRAEEVTTFTSSTSTDREPSA